MRTHPFRTVAIAIAGLLMTAGGWVAAQTAPQRIVLLPFDAEASVETFALSFPTALQRALNEIDGVYVPPIGDAGVVLQRALAAGGDALDDVARVFGAGTVVIGRIAGSDALTVEVLTVRGDEERNRTFNGRVGDLPGLWKAVADAVLEAAGIIPAPADRAAMRALLDDAPSLPSLGPLGLAASRLPGARLDQLEGAASLDGGSAWVRSELARALALAGSDARARTEAEAAVGLASSAETLTLLGIVLLAQDDDPGAAVAFRSALERNPHHAVALVGLAEAEAGAANRLDLLERAIAASPRLVDAHLALAAAQTTPTRVVQTLRRAAASLPDSASIQGALIDAALAAGDARGALDLLRAAVADPIGRSSTIYGLAALLPNDVRTGAFEVLREGIRRFPGAGSLRRLEIDLLRRSGDQEGADRALRSWVDDGFADVEDVVGLAEALAARGEFEEAQAYLAAVADADGEGDLRLARVELAAGRSRAALATLEPAIAAGSADPLRRTLHAIALGRVGRTAEAITALEAVVAEVRAAPTDEGAVEAAELANRALAVLREQRLIGVEGAVALDSAAAEAFQQGLYALETGDLLAARDAFARAWAVQQVGVVAFYEGYARQLLGDPRGAIVAYQAARAELGENDVLLNNLGYAHLQVGRLDLALESLRAAVAANPENARAHLNLGLAHYGLARFRDAVASFDTAVALDPGLAESAGATIDDARRRAAP